MKLINFLFKKTSFVLLFIYFVLGIVDERWALAALVCMLGPVILSVLKGRYWCGNLCPRGSFYDNIVSKLCRNKQTPWLLKSTVFRYIVVILLLSMLFNGILNSGGNLGRIGLVFYRIIALTTFLGVILSFIYNERTWCNFCPMGTLSNLISQLNNNRKTLKVNTLCSSCGICSKKCPMGIIPYKYKGKYLNDPDCIQCGRCSSSCPRHFISYD